MKCPDQANPETENSLVVAQGCKRRGEWGVTANGYGFLLGVMDVPELGSGDSCITCEYTKIQWLMDLKMVSFVV